MRIVFSVCLLCFALFFTIKSFDYEYMNNAGQVGAGFFPRWIGLLLIVSIGYSLFRDIKEKKAEAGSPKYAQPILFIIVITVIFIFLLNILGALLAMIVYMFAVCLFFNRGRIVFNAIFSLVFPICTYLLLDVWLNAGLPKGVLPFF